MKYTINKSSNRDIKNHLNRCSCHFAPPLDTYVNIDEYSNKIFSKAVRFEAFEQSTLVGLIAMYVNHDSKIGYITNVSVDVEYKGQNVGNTLIKEVKMYALDNGIKKIELEVYLENIKAINFYEKHGFRICGSTYKTQYMDYKVTRDYNQEFQDTDDHKYAYDFDFDVMHDYMIKSFEPFFNKGSVLELGSFKGAFTKRLLDYFDTVTCIEASDEAAKAAKRLLGDRVEIYTALFENTVLPTKYDNIILTHVLEHIDNPVELIKQIRENWLSENGRLFIVCPNANAASRRIAVKMGLISHNTAITSAEKEHGHRITYTLDTLARDVREAGLATHHQSGIFFKALANFQWDQLLQTDIISKEYLDGCFDLGKEYPDLCSSIMIIAKHKY